MKQMQTSTPWWLTRFVKAGNLLERILTIIGGFAVAVFVSAVFLDVTARVISHPLSWCQEIALFAYVWAIFMGSAIGVRCESHFTIDLLVNQTRGTLHRIIDIFDHIVILAFASVLGFYGWRYACSTISRLSQPSGIPMICGTICMFISAVSMLFFIVEYFILFFSSMKTVKPESDEKEDKS